MGKLNDWRQLVKQTYHSGVASNKNYTFRQALKDASRIKGKHKGTTHKAHKKGRKRRGGGEGDTPDAADNAVVADTSEQNTDSQPTSSEQDTSQAEEKKEEAEPAAEEKKEEAESAAEENKEEAAPAATEPTPSGGRRRRRRRKTKKCRKHSRRGRKHRKSRR